MEEVAKFLASCEFASPHLFWIAGGLVLLTFFFPLFGRRKGLALDLRYWRGRIEFRTKRVWVLWILVAITSLLMATALGNPQTLTKQSVRIYGKPVMVVIDVSGSMQVKGGGDLSSVEKARGVLNDILSRDSGADFGLLLFSTENYIARYFAYKTELLKDTLENDKQISFISTGTRITPALAKADIFLSERFPHTRGSEPNTAIILVSDLEADPEPLAEMADEIERAHWAGIKIYAIVIEVEGQRAVDLPQIKGAKIVGMNDTDGIGQICKEIAAMGSSPIREEEILLRKSLIPFWIAPILGLIVLCLLLSETYFRKMP
jgi:hypothetical protein